MSLVDKQDKFSAMISLLVEYMRFRGFQVTYGDAYRDDRVTYGHPRSTHRSRLAVDLNLFKDGKYLADGDAHEHFHDFWDLIGGAERISGDKNHYSLELNGVR